MDKLTDAILKDRCHQLLKRRGCVTITHLHYLASQRAKYCGECRLMDVFWYNAYLFICFSILSFERYAALAISLRMISWSGNGVTSLTRLSFCSHKSKTVCSLLFFFSMQSIGTAWCATAGIHHCAVVYLSIFWEFFTEMLWVFQQTVVDMFFGIN